MFLVSNDLSLAASILNGEYFNRFNEEMMESLFGYTVVEKNKTAQKKDSSSHDQSPQYIQIIEAKKAQNLSILLRALNVTLEEVCDALLEGGSFVLSIFLQELLIVKY